MAEADIQRYLDRTEAQHTGKRKFSEHTASILRKLDWVHGLAKDTPKMFDIMTAVGDQLDIIGEIVGINRRNIPLLVPNVTEVPDDDLYRTILLTGIIQNYWDGTNEGFYEIWEATANEILDAEFIDNQDMTMDVNLIGEVNDAIADLIAYGYIIPKPMGVNLNVTVKVASNPGDSKIYVGTALYEAEICNLGRTAMPEIDDIQLLIDEKTTDEMIDRNCYEVLLDENSIMLTDGEG